VLAPETSAVRPLRFRSITAPSEMMLTAAFRIQEIG
jgi:hypothetical protein